MLKKRINPDNLIPVTSDTCLPTWNVIYQFIRNGEEPVRIEIFQVTEVSGGVSYRLSYQTGSETAKLRGSFEYLANVIIPKLNELGLQSEVVKVKNLYPHETTSN